MSELVPVFAMAEKGDPGLILRNFGEDYLRKIADFWGVLDAKNLHSGVLPSLISVAWKSEKNASRALKGLSPPQQQVVEIFRRHHGAVNGAVLRLELLARKTLKIHNVMPQGGRPHLAWQEEGVQDLVEKAVLIPVRAPALAYVNGLTYSRTFLDRLSNLEKSFPELSLSPGLLRLVTPAKMAPWMVPAPPGPITPLPSPPAARLAFYLRRLVKSLTGEVVIKLTKQGEIAKTSLKSLVKAFPIPGDSDFPLLDPQAFCVLLLRRAGVLLTDEEGRLLVDAACARQFFESDAVQQANAWVRHWVKLADWRENKGLLDNVQDSSVAPVITERLVLTWYLNSLANAEGCDWVDLASFLEVHQSMGCPVEIAALSEGVKLPDLSQFKDGKERTNRFWEVVVGGWYKTAIFGVLAWFGLVERGQAQSSQGVRWCFRLTPLGRAVFANPDQKLPEPASEKKFFLVQPSFEVVAYLENAPITDAALLGCLTEEPEKSAAGKVQTARLTAAGVYLALESGMQAPQLMVWMRDHARNELPNNVVQALGEWSARRDAIVIRDKVDVLAFPTAGEAKAFAAKHPCQRVSELTMIVEAAATQHLKPLEIDHWEPAPPTWKLKPDGSLVCGKRLNLVERARLAKIADRTTEGWKVCRNALARASGGLKPADVLAWLDEHLKDEIPPLLEMGIRGWTTKGLPAKLAEVVVLHLPVQKYAELIESHPSLQLYLIAQPGPGWWIVQKDKHEEVLALLEELGFCVTPNL